MVEISSRLERQCTSFFSSTVCLSLFRMHCKSQGRSLYFSPSFIRISSFTCHQFGIIVSPPVYQIFQPWVRSFHVRVSDLGALASLTPTGGISFGTRRPKTAGLGKKWLRSTSSAAFRSNHVDDIDDGNVTNSLGGFPCMLRPDFVASNHDKVE